MDFKTDNLWLMQGDCLDRMKEIPSGSVDMVLTDPPYGTTACKWDSIIPLTWHLAESGKVIYLEEALLNGYSFAYFEKNKNAGMWEQLNRIIKHNGAIVLMGQTPFDKLLGASNLEMLRYEWIWEKTAATGHLNAKKMPMKAHENIMVFYKNKPTYNPQITEGHKPTNSYTKRHNSDGECYGKTRSVSGGGKTTRYPRSIQVFVSDKQKIKLHPTQKPVALMEYLIKTYTNAGEKVLDFTMGSGTTGVACVNTGRNFIGIEKDGQYFEIAKKRILSL